MRCRFFLRIEYIVVKYVAPRAPLLGAQSAQPQHAVLQYVEWRPHVMRRRPPPVIYEHIELVQAFDVMPPHARKKKCITGFESNFTRVIQCFTKPRIPVEIRVIKIDQADRLTGRRDIPRSDVKVVELVGWKERETPTSCNAARDVVGKIEMSRYPCLVADPDADQGLEPPQIEIIFRSESGKPNVQQGRPYIGGRWLEVVDMREQPIEKVIERNRGNLEIEAAQVIVVADPPLDLRRTIRRRQWLTGVILPEIVGGIL